MRNAKFIYSERCAPGDIIYIYSSIIVPLEEKKTLKSTFIYLLRIDIFEDFKEPNADSLKKVLLKLF